jgi:iron complex outermembrane receptor protein
MKEYIPNKNLIIKHLIKVKILFFGLMLSTTTYAQNDTGTISGIIVDSTNKPLEHVSVALKGLSKGDLTNKKGVYTIKNVFEGTHIIEIKLVGFKPIEKTIEVKANEITELPAFILKEDHYELDQVHLNINPNKFAKKESNYVARLPLKNLENPQVYNIVSKELMQQQVVVNFDDAIKNAPGVGRLWSSTGRSGDGAGYFSMRGFSVQPTMINGIAGLTNGGVDPANIENIESIKGPSGTLFGSSLISFGGLINIVTKKPYDITAGEITYTGGSFGLSRISADVNAPLNENKTALFRLNTAYHYEGSFQDAGFKKSIFIAPSFSYKANERLSFLINTEYYNSESTNPLMVFLNRSRPLIATTPEELNIDFKRSFTSNDITVKNPTLNLFGQINYKLSNRWISQTNLSRSVRQTDGYYSYVMFLGATDTLLSRYITDQTAISTTTGIQQNFIGDFKIGKMRNRLVLGLDFLNIQSHNNNTPYVLFDMVNSVEVNDPRYGQLNRQALDAKFASNPSSTRTLSKGSNYSVYFSDVLNLTENFIAMASLRLDHFDNLGTQNFANGKTTGKYYQTALSPKLGLVYQVVKDKASVFVNYMNGFRNVAPVVQPLADISGTFRPQQANQIEGGIKLDAFNKKLSLTASYYDILVSNMTRPETLERNGTTYLITVQNGSQKSQGVEFDLISSPIVGLNLIAGYSYNDSKAVNTDANNQGRRPASAGPEHLANAWVSYTLTKGKIKGFGLGIGGNYASENKITNNALTGVFTLPSYTAMNATIFYHTPSYRIGVKVDNLTDKEYYGGWSTVERQLPRRFLGTLTLLF